MFLFFERLLTFGMAERDPSPANKKAKPSAISIDGSSDNCSETNDNDAEYRGEVVYANKGADHTIEHVYSLHNLELRKLHWKECVLSSPADELVEACASAEQRDCLSSVTLCWAGKDWGTTMTQDQLEALKEGQSAQVMDQIYRWELEAEEHSLEQTLMSGLGRGAFQKLYGVYAYRKEAFRRLKAVENIVGRIPEEDKVRICRNDVFFKLVSAKLKAMTDDPREELVEKVALYHWVLKNDLFTQTPLPLV